MKTETNLLFYLFGLYELSSPVVDIFIMFLYFSNIVLKILFQTVFSIFYPVVYDAVRF